MADPLVIDYIELNAKGITDIKAELDRLKESEDAAREAHEKLVKSLEDPAQAKYAQQLMETRKRLSDIERLDRQRLSHMSRQAGLQSRLEDVSSGRFGQRLASEAKMSQFEQTVRTAEMRVQNQLKYGRTLGGVVSGAQSFGASRLGKGAMALGATVGGLAMQGFSGTVEMNRFNTELTLVTRELAATVKPALDLATAGLKGVRGILESLGETGQNLVGVFIGLVSAATAWKALMFGRHIVSGLSAAAGAAPIGGGAAGAGILGGLFGMGGRSAPAGSPGGPVGTGDATAMVAASTGSRLGGARAMWSRLPGWGKALAIGGAVVGGANALDAGRGASRESWYELYRRSGSSRVGAALGTTFSSISEALGAGDLAGAMGFESTDERRRALARARVRDTYGSSGGRRNVTQEGAGFEGVGSAYERISDAAANTFATEGRGDRSDAELIQAMKDLAEAFNRSMPGDAPVRAMRGR